MVARIISMDISDLDPFWKNLEMETMNSEHREDINNYGFSIAGDDGWSQHIQEYPSLSELSYLQPPKRLHINNNIEPYFLENGKAEERKDDCGILKCSSSFKNTSNTLSFCDPASAVELHVIPAMKKAYNQSKTARKHVIAERKRRERAAEFIHTLSALVPGSKKRDKITVLAETIDYIKQMQEKVKKFEQHVAAKDKNDVDEFRYEQPEVLSVSSTNEQNPKIEVKVFGKTYLIKIHCFQACSGTMVDALNLVESLHLRVVSANSVQYSEQILDLTIMSEVLRFEAHILLLEELTWLENYILMNQI